MGQRNRQGEWTEDDRQGQNASRPSRHSGERSVQGSGQDREQDWRQTGQAQEGRSRGYSGGESNQDNYGREGRGGESMRHNVEDNWRGQSGGSSACDYDYGYGRSGVSERDYERERGGAGNEYYGGGGMFGGGMGGYTSGGHTGGGLGSNSSSSNYPDNRRSEQGYRDRGHDREGGWWDKMTNEVSTWFGGEGDENRSRESRRGKGPKGYTRSDERIREDINERLTEHHALDASDIDLEVNSGEIVLSGNVETRYEKRLAEDVAESVSGVKHVENRLRVGRGGSYSTSMGSSETSPTLTSGDSESSFSTETGKSAGQNS